MELLGRVISNRNMADCHLWFMINGSWLMVHGNLWFMVKGQLMVQDSWLKINELLDGREEKLF